MMFGCTLLIFWMIDILVRRVHSADTFLQEWRSVWLSVYAVMILRITAERKVMPLKPPGGTKPRRLKVWDEDFLDGLTIFFCTTLLFLYSIETYSFRSTFGHRTPCWIPVFESNPPWWGAITGRRLCKNFLSPYVTWNIERDLSAKNCVLGWFFTSLVFVLNECPPWFYSVRLELCFCTIYCKPQRTQIDWWWFPYIWNWPEWIYRCETVYFQSIDFTRARKIFQPFSRRSDKIQ